MFTKLLQTLAQALRAADIDYAILGGQAVLLYGEPRATKDIDVTLGLTIDALPRLLALVAQCGWQVLTEDPQDFVGQTFVLPVQDGSTGIRIDFIFSFTPFEQETLDRAHAVQVGGIMVKYVSPEDLVIHKVFAGRARDLEDVRGILLRQSPLDMEHIKRWLESLSEGSDVSFLARFETVLRSLPG